MPDKAYSSYVICTSPRSGSTMLCELLAATRIAGYPASLFHKPSINAWLKYYDLALPYEASRREILQAIFNAALARGKGETNYFGLRLQCGSFEFFLEQLHALYPGCVTDLERIEAAFGPTLFVYLSRTDTLGQAISYVRAEQIGIWHRKIDGTDLERLEPTRRRGYDPDVIRSQLNEFTRYNVAWRRWFRQQSIEPLLVTYETLSQEPEAVLAKILSALGLDGSLAHGIQPPTTKLADETNRDWRKRFEAGV